MLIFHLPGSVLGYNNEDCQDHQFLLLKHQELKHLFIYVDFVGSNTEKTLGGFQTERLFLVCK